MKITTVSLSKTIPTGAFMNDKVGMEATLDEGETPEEVLSNLAQKITNWHDKQYKPNWNGLPTDEFGLRAYTENKRKEPDELVSEDVMELIKNAPNLESLSSYKLVAGTKPEWMKHYMNRLKELSV